MQSCSHTGTGDTNLYGSDTALGSGQSAGKTDFHCFGDGSSATRNHVEDTDCYSDSTSRMSGLPHGRARMTLGYREGIH